MKIFNLTSAGIAAIVLFSCANPTSQNTDFIDEHNSKNAVDWSGQYKGSMQLEEEVVAAELKLNDDETYTLKVTEKENDAPKEMNGKFEWNKEGSHITLSNTPKGKAMVQVGEDVLLQNGKDQMYKFVKDSELLGKKWMLTEIDGVKIEAQKEERNNAYLILTEEYAKVNGSLGCNRFFGTYILRHLGHLSFSPLGATMMMCQNMETENKFSENLEKVAFYSIENNQLSLKNGDEKVILKFDIAK